MAKSAPALRVRLSDGSLDVTVPADTLAWTVLLVVALKRDAINAHRAGKIEVGANASGGHAIHFHADVSTLLFNTTVTPP